MRTSICFPLLAIAVFVVIAGVSYVQAADTTEQGPKPGGQTILAGVTKVINGALTIFTGAIQVPFNVLGGIFNAFTGIISSLGSQNKPAGGNTTTPSPTANKTA